MILEVIVASSARHRAKLKAKHTKVRLRQTGQMKVRRAGKRMKRLFKRRV